MAIEVGQLAPSFELPSSRGETFSLESLRGKHIVLFFYPKDLTPGCTTENQDFRNLYPQFLEANTEVVGVSPDDLKKHDRFVCKHDLPFPLLSDTEHVVSELYGVWKEKNMYGKKYWGIERTTFVIDKDGYIRHIYSKVKVNGHAANVLQAVQSL